MTAAQNMAIAPRGSRAFKFFRTRTVGNVPETAEFFPGEGSRLRFANRDVDTFVAQGVPAGLFQAGDAVEVQYNGSGDWTTVFRGGVERIVDSHARGDERTQSVTFAGPWSAMSRLVFRQTWKMFDAQGDEVSFSSSRVILGQKPDGSAQTMAQQLGEILNWAAQKCGFAIGSVAASGLYLPFDEARDITCADAVRRELRFFPKRIVRFGYASATPEIEIVEPSGDDAPYVAAVPKSERVYEYTAHPVACVDVAVDATDVVVGGSSRTYHQIYPANGDPDSIDRLRVTVPLGPGGGSTTTESFKSITEDIPQNFGTYADWWQRKHPRLANVALQNITITNGSRSPSHYPRIAKSTKGEIEEAGLHCEVSVFTCDCKITTADDEEEDIKLRMDFLTTDATGTEEHPRTYTWQTGSESTAGETLPGGLAEALFRQRCGALLAERMAVRLGSVWPKVGDMCDGLYLQSFEVDVGDLTAQLSFGRPEHLSAEDMRSLLNGFRQRGWAKTARLRAAAADEDADEEDAPGGIPPLSASDWSPGRKLKAAVFGANGGKIRLVGADVGANKTMEVKSLSYPTADGAEASVKVLATDDFSVAFCHPYKVALVGGDWCIYLPADILLVENAYVSPVGNLAAKAGHAGWHVLAGYAPGADVWLNVSRGTNGHSASIGLSASQGAAWSVLVCGGGSSSAPPVQRVVGALVLDPAGSSQQQTATVVSEVALNAVTGGGYKLQKKTQQLTVAAAGEESAWSDVFDTVPHSSNPIV